MITSQAFYQQNKWATVLKFWINHIFFQLIISYTSITAWGDSDKLLHPFFILPERHVPILPPCAPWEDSVNTAVWKLIPSLGLAFFHQQNCWFMSNTAKQGATCLHQFTSNPLFPPPLTNCMHSAPHIQCMKSNAPIVQSAEWSLLPLTPPGSSGQRRPLTW